MGKNKFYAVAKGRRRGIYRSWAECQKQVNGFKGAIFKGFGNRQDASDFIRSHINEKQDTTRNSLGTSNELVKKKERTSRITSLGNLTGKKRKDRNIDNLNHPSEKLEPVEKKRKLDNKIVVYTDGSCTSNGNRKRARAGVGVFFALGDLRNVARRLPGKQTNNRAELSAISDAIEKVEESVDIEIRTDSIYSMNVLRNKWKAKKNERLIKNIKELMKSRSGKVFFVKVPAHTGKKDGNYYADLFANRGAEMDL